MLRVCADEEEKRMIEAAADAANMTLSEYVRRAALGRRISAGMPSADYKAATLLRQCVGLAKAIYKEELASPSLTWNVIQAAKRLSAKLHLGH